MNIIYEKRCSVRQNTLSSVPHDLIFDLAMFSHKLMYINIHEFNDYINIMSTRARNLIFYNPIKRILINAESKLLVKDNVVVVR